MGAGNHTGLHLEETDPSFLCWVRSWTRCWRWGRPAEHQGGAGDRAVGLDPPQTVVSSATRSSANLLSAAAASGFHVYCTLEKPAEVRPGSARRVAGGGVEAGLLSGPFRFGGEGNLEVLLFSIQSKLRACKLPSLRAPGVAVDLGY